MQTVREVRRFISEFDGVEDRYIIEYPRCRPTGPLVFYLHGGLSHAEQGFCDDYDWCFRKLRNEVMGRNGVYVSPEYRGDSWMNAAAEADIRQLITDIRAEFALQCVVLTGASMGGTAALIYASHHPDSVLGVVALCPATDMKALWADLSTRREPLSRLLRRSIEDAYGGTPNQDPAEYSYRSSIEQVRHLTMPVVLRHGDSDDLIPVWHARWLAAALRKQGTPVRYDEIPGGDHDSPTVDTPWREYLDFLLQSDSSAK
ncbi:MAG: alpha/beta hydrolase family protein [Armatimonadota bacterium]